MLLEYLRCWRFLRCLELIWLLQALLNSRCSTWWCLSSRSRVVWRSNRQTHDMFQAQLADHPCLYSGDLILQCPRTDLRSLKTSNHIKSKRHIEYHYISLNCIFLIFLVLGAFLALNFLEEQHSAPWVRVAAQHSVSGKRGKDREACLSPGAGITSPSWKPSSHQAASTLNAFNARVQCTSWHLNVQRMGSDLIGSVNSSATCICLYII